ncbi:membrane protein YqaA with SNARE-associated domain [Xanthomonas arboricola]|uniref:hypothetical protein n=1 Tax=Xanthomonas euroxanthea TaxID=2259622 RepID=UPI00142FF70B|nr:hypothetical protein [Xanthomonas euroxanthea]NJC36394.1 membrane protein YqaA with SNARE-associated domain [Xanthomonas euroxanthea]
MASNAEIARDLLIASIGNTSGAQRGDWIGDQFKTILKAVGEAVQEEDKRKEAADRLLLERQKG